LISNDRSCLFLSFLTNSATLLDCCSQLAFGGSHFLIRMRCGLELAEVEVEIAVGLEEALGLKELESVESQVERVKLGLLWLCYSAEKG
jgi:hypothetical protein